MGGHTDLEACLITLIRGGKRKLSDGFPVAVCASPLFVNAAIQSAHAQHVPHNCGSEVSTLLQFRVHFIAVDFSWIVDWGCAD